MNPKEPSFPSTKGRSKNQTRGSRRVILSHRSLRSLPKIDLHRHLDCSLRWSTLVELAATLRIDIGQNQQSLGNEFFIRSPLKSLNSVLDRFQKIRRFFASKEIVERIALEACEDAFNDGVRILELRYSPVFMTLGAPSCLSFEENHLALLRGLEQARKKLPMAIGLIGIIDRTQAPDIIQKTCDFFVKPDIPSWGWILLIANKDMSPENLHPRLKKFEVKAYI